MIFLFLVILIMLSVFIKKRQNVFWIYYLSKKDNERYYLKRIYNRKGFLKFCIFLRKNNIDKYNDILRKIIIYNNTLDLKTKEIIIKILQEEICEENRFIISRIYKSNLNNNLGIVALKALKRYPTLQTIQDLQYGKTNSSNSAVKRKTRYLMKYIKENYVLAV